MEFIQRSKLNTHAVQKLNEQSCSVDAYSQSYDRSWQISTNLDKTVFNSGKASVVLIQYSKQIA